jgi:hypothetical protein
LILAKKKKKKREKKPYRIHKIQSTEFERLNKLECPSEEGSVPLGREKKAISSGERGTWEGKWKRWVGALRGRGELDLVLGEGKGLKTGGTAERMQIGNLRK